LPTGNIFGVIGSMGATAVLLYAVPMSPFSQPWPVIAGHSVSALIGVSCARLIPNPAIATACAVGASIAAMHVFKCIHPPGGATAFTAVMGGELISDLGYGYVFYPVLLNVMVMVVVAVCVNYPFKWRRYPSVFAQKTNQAKVGGADISQELHSRIIFAMRSLDSFVDVSEEDLVYLANTVINNMPGQNQTIGKALK
jgi:CBS-domain-containing membrane protein